MRLVLVSFTTAAFIILLYETLHNRPFSVTSEESLRDSEPPGDFLTGYVPEHQGTGYFMRSECIKLNCACVIHIIISHIVSCMLH